MIYYYQRSSVYELDVMIPKDEEIKFFVLANKMRIFRGNNDFAEILQEKLQNIAKGKQRDICMRIGRLCGSKIRSVQPVGDQPHFETFIVEVEGGTLKDWAEIIKSLIRKL